MRTSCAVLRAICFNDTSGIPDERSANDRCGFIVVVSGICTLWARYNGTAL